MCFSPSVLLRLVSADATDEYGEGTAEMFAKIHGAVGIQVTGGIHVILTGSLVKVANNVCCSLT